MSEQQSLFYETIQEKFESFHQAHPEVYTALVRYCREMTERGFRHGGIRMVWGRARWYLTVETDESKEFKMNDHYHSRYARLIMEREQDLAGFFELRRLTA